MAVIQPTVTYPADGITKVTWSTVTNADTAGAFMIRGVTGVIGRFAATGTFGSATVNLGASNEDVAATYRNLSDKLGAVIALTAAGEAEFDTASLWIAPQFSGGGGTQDIDCEVVLRG